MNANSRFNRKTARLLGFWLLISLLSGCAAPINENPSASQGRLVILWHSFTDARQDALLQLGDRFNAERPNNLTLIIEYHKDLPALLPTLSPEQRPDLVIATPQDTQIYAAHDLSFLAPETIPNDLLPMGKELFTMKGALQALPLGLATYILYTNDDWLRDIGYAPNTAILEDLRLSTCRATDFTSGQVGLGLPSQPGVFLALLAAGESAIVGDDGAIHFDDPAGTRLGAIIKEGVRAACIRTFAIPADGIEQFSDSTMAMLVESSLNRQDVAVAVAAESNFTLKLASLPGPTGPGATLWYGIGILPTQPSGQRYEAAQTVLTWLLQPETQAEWAVQTQYLPVSLSGLEAQLATLSAEDSTLEGDLLQFTRQAAESGSWVIWPPQAQGKDCRTALVHALTALNSELPAHEALQNAAAVCNAEIAP